VKCILFIQLFALAHTAAVKHGAALCYLVYTCGVIGTCNDTSSILDMRCDVKYDDKWSLLACKTQSATRCRANNRTMARDRPHREIRHELLFNGAAGALVHRVQLLGAVKRRLQQRRIPGGSTHKSGKPAELRENADDGRQDAARRSQVGVEVVGKSVCPGLLDELQQIGHLAGVEARHEGVEGGRWRACKRHKLLRLLEVHVGQHNQPGHAAVEI
jgi:hypothetical protein